MSTCENLSLLEMNFELKQCTQHLNKCPMRTMLNLTPKEAWSRYKPSLSHMREFECMEFSRVVKEKRKILDDKSVKCIFIGYILKETVTSYLILTKDK